MSYNLAKLNSLNSVAKANTKGDRLKIVATNAPNRFGFISIGQWLLLSIANVVCLSFVAFACVLLKGSI